LSVAAIWVRYGFGFREGLATTAYNKWELKITSIVFILS